MKFCYIDESGIGDEPFGVMVGVLVDSHRMRPTKEGWDVVLAELSHLAGRSVTEMHTRDFYRGSSPWTNIDGPTRAQVVDLLLEWLSSRKHKFVYTATDKAKWNAHFPADPRAKEVRSLWRFLGLHIALQVQKAGQKHKSNKGNTVLIFDREVKEENRFTDLILDPPSWTDTYYNRSPKQERLDQLVDVPYFGDSKHVLLLQAADLIAFFLRRHLELQNNGTERYAGERARVATWIAQAMGWGVDRSIAYPKMGRCKCAEMFYEYAPSQLVS